VALVALVPRTLRRMLIGRRVSEPVRP